MSETETQLAQVRRTPLPWKRDGSDIWHQGVSYTDSGDPHLFTGIEIHSKLRDSSTARANLDFIVRACNAHDDMLAVLNRIAICHGIEDVIGSANFAEMRAAIAKAEAVTP